MRRYLCARAIFGILVVVGAMAGRIFAGDEVRVEGLRYTEEVKVVGLKEGKLAVEIRGKEKLFDLADVDWIHVAGQANFNEAEDSRADAKTAQEFYRKALDEVKDKQLKALVQLRSATPPTVRPKPVVAPATEPVLEGKVGPVKYFSMEADGARIVYVVDNSGSMLETFQYLTKAVSESVNGLQAEQMFDVVMTQESATLLFPKMQAATTEAKKQLGEMLNKSGARGMQDDLLSPFKEGFEKAFRLRPDTIIFITDGKSDPRLIDEIKKLNRAQKVHVHTIGMLTEHDAMCEDQLKDIAKGNGGKFLSVTQKALDAAPAQASTRPIAPNAPGIANTSPAVNAAATAPALDVKVWSVRCFGLETESARIVFVANYSGLITDTFKMLAKTLDTSVGELQPEQMFNALMVSEDVTAIFPDMKLATAEAKTEFGDKLKDFKATRDPGSINPYKDAFEKAFGMKPDTIIFITDGKSDPRLPEEIKQLNLGHNVIVHTVGLRLEHDATTADQIKEIAKENGGQCRIVPDKELEKKSD